jgi:hypothetical protein
VTTLQFAKTLFEKIKSIVRTTCCILVVVHMFVSRAHINTVSMLHGTSQQANNQQANKPTMCKTNDRCTRKHRKHGAK